jgi:pilus assembly protein Flp/PilA
MQSTKAIPSNVVKIGFLKRTKVIFLNVCKEFDGQDLIEYALMAGFVAVAAGAIMPGVASQISEIFSKVASVLTNAAG